MDSRSAVRPAASQTTRRERVTRADVAGFPAGAEPADALLGGAVGEGIGDDAALTFALDRVVADRGGGAQRFFEIARFEPRMALLGAVGPHAGVAVGLQFLPDEQAVGALDVAAAHPHGIHLFGHAGHGLHVVADFVRDHVGLREVAGRAKVEAMKHDLLANPALGTWWTGVWERLRLSLIASARDPKGGPKSALAGPFANMLAELGQALREDPALQRQVNRFARRTAVGVATRYGGQIVQLVSETVKRWDARTVTDRIEGAVSRDLQFIRLNGTLVGGLVGVVIHLISRLL